MLSLWNPPWVNCTNSFTEDDVVYGYQCLWLESSIGLLRTDVTAIVENGPCLICLGPANEMSVILIRVCFTMPLALILTVGLSLSLLARRKVTTTNPIILCVKRLCVHYFKHLVFLQQLLLLVLSSSLSACRVERMTIFLTFVKRRSFTFATSSPHNF